MREVRRLTRNPLPKATLDELTETMCQVVENIMTDETSMTLENVVSLAIDFIEDNQESFSPDTVYHLGLRATGTLPTIIKVVIDNLESVRGTNNAEYYKDIEGHYYKLYAIDGKPRIIEVDEDAAVNGMEKTDE